MNFRLAYDELKERHTPQKAAKEYLEILRMAAMDKRTCVRPLLFICPKGFGNLHTRAVAETGGSVTVRYVQYGK